MASFLGGIFGQGNSTPDIGAESNLYQQRLGQISDFQTQLTGASQQYSNALNNMYQTAFSQYMPDLAGQMGASGLGIDSGAFAAQLARTAGQFTAQGLAQNAQQNITNINNVNSQYGSAWNQMFNAQNQATMAGYNTSQANQGALGGFIGRLAMTGLGAAIGGPGGAMVGSAGSSMFGGGGSSGYTMGGTQGTPYYGGGQYSGMSGAGFSPFTGANSGFNPGMNKLDLAY